MNPLTKIVATTTLIGSTLIGAAPSCASNSVVAALPQITAVTAQVGEWIASELQVQLAKALAIPHAIRSARGPSVFVIEGNHMIVEAKRLPPEVPLEALAEAAKAAFRL
jgi:hypothetical protein